VGLGDERTGLVEKRGCKEVYSEFYQAIGVGSFLYVMVITKFSVFDSV